MDLQVQKAQQYLNTTYGTKPGFGSVPEDGQTGWPTVYGIIRGLQIELGITSPVNNFGAGTSAAFTSKFGTLSSGNTTKNVTALIQCALWCKGYYGGPTFGSWSNEIDGGIRMIRNSLGLSNEPTITLKLLRSLLSMDAYTLLPGGNDFIRAGQQWLNGRYLNRRDFDVLPSDGLFTRSVQMGAVLALQYEMEMADYDETTRTGATGDLGPTTRALLQAHAMVGIGSIDTSKKFVSLFQFLLACNGYPSSVTGTFDSDTSSRSKEFQSLLELPVTGAGDYQTWLGLLISSGDPNRPASGMDTSLPITAARANSLYADGYRVAGRYLTVSGKAIVPGEIETLLSSGFSIVPIFQNYNNDPSFFTKNIGLDHGLQAVIRARQLGFKKDTIIFFSVDYDAFGDEILTIVADYFHGIKESLSKSRDIAYRIGVYGTRNVCQKLKSTGLADAVWVSGMSYGFSGNLGFKMPEDWMYNQIQEVKPLNIDRNIVSVRARPAKREDVNPTPLTTDHGFVPFYWAMVKQAVLAEGATADNPQLVSVKDASRNVLFGLQRGKYDDLKWSAYTPFPDRVPGIPQNFADAQVQARDKYFALADGPLSWPSYAYEGDLQHMAATAQGVVEWGNGQEKATMEVGDLGGWGLDFVQLWVSYKTRGNGMTIRAFVLKYLGGSGVEAEEMGFSQGDVIADADGWLIGTEIIDGVPIDEAVRKILVERNQWTFRLSLFMRRRFGLATRDTMIQAVSNVFSSQWPWSAFPRNAFLDGQPNATTAEAQEFAVAATDKLFSLAAGV